MIKISVIIPVYNTEKFLENCLNSILNQTLKDIEIICVDDGSTDSSPQICDYFAKKDARVKIIHQQNGRQANARNNGIKKAKGEYISFIDSDDQIQKEFLEELYQNALENNADIAVGNVKTIPLNIFNYVGNWSFFCNGNILTTPRDKIGCIYSCAVWNKIYRRSFLIKNQILFNEQIFLEDVTFNQIACILANKIILCPTVFYFYTCNNQTSFMKKAHKTKKVLSMLDMTQEARKFLKKKCSIEYFYILDSFEIYNIWGWLKSIEKEKIKKSFFRKAKKIFKNIDIANNTFILPESKYIYNNFTKAKEYSDLFYQKKIYSILLKLIRFVFYENKIWKLYFINIPLIKKNEKNFYLFGIPVIKKKIIDNTIRDI